MLFGRFLFLCEAPQDFTVYMCTIFSDEFSMKIKQFLCNNPSFAMNIFHNRQLHSSPFHSFMRFLNMEIFNDCLVSFERSMWQFISQESNTLNPKANCPGLALPPWWLYLQFLSMHRCFSIENLKGLVCRYLNDWLYLHDCDRKDI